MSRKPDAPTLIRLASFFLVFSIPSLYLPGFYPFFVLPASVVAFSCAGSAFAMRLLREAQRRNAPSTAMRTEAAALIFLSPVAVFLSYYALLAASSLFHAPETDVFHLYLAQSRVIFSTACSFACASSALHALSARWKRLEPLMLTLIVVVFFWSQGHHALSILDHPVKAAFLAAFFMGLQIVQLSTLAGRTSKRLVPLAFMLPFAVLLTVCLVGAYNAKSVVNNGGLIQPTMFRFDFSPYLSLQDEIQTNDRLVMIVRTKEEYAGTFMRREYLSGWNPEKGFYEKAAPGESPQPTKVTGEKQDFPFVPYKGRQRVEQDCFIVNFDPSSLVAMDYPVMVQPLSLWNQSSFTGAYSVTSETSGFIPFELYDSAQPETADFLSFYTYVDGTNLARLRPLAQEITSGITGYYERVFALTEFLHDGEYRYSLRPGLAVDGDQLGNFLFESKKGYCTYFAFSLCLMLRSIGIPSRVAVGFFLQPDSGALDYYPVRSNMAHAWVEVFFPEYGWISFDPTTTQLAEGENIELSDAPGGEDFMRLLGEIIDNKLLVGPAREAASQDPTRFSLSRALHALFVAIVALVCSFAVMFLIIRQRLPKNPRKHILSLCARMNRRLRISRGKPNSAETRDRIFALGDPDAENLFALAQKARFARECGTEDAELATQSWRSIKTRHCFSFRGLFCVLAFISACAFTPPVSADTPENGLPVSDPSTALLSRAKNAVISENWEHAIALLSEGIRLYPGQPGFHAVLGNVYYGQGLYESAYRELSEARSLGSDETELYSSLSNTLSCLNRDSEAIEFLSIYLSRKDDDLYAWSNYGWLCYKTHRLEKGIAALLGVIERFGPDGNIYVGLGNLYTAAFMYPEAKKYYTRAIELAEEGGQKYLASIYYYNRSILEKTFFHFAEAYQDTVFSLDRAPRSSGYLMQSELELRKLDFVKALSLYMKALSLDSTPLATIGLADTWLKTGYPERAFVYISSLKKKTDRSWIANYGTTIYQYEADYHMLQKDYFRLLLNREKRTVIHGLSTKLSSWFHTLSWSVYAWYHDTLFRFKNIDIAKHHSTTVESEEFHTTQTLYTNSFYFLAFDAWRATAAPYLEESERIEVGFIPELKPSYLHDKGTLFRDVSMLDQAIATLNPVWEREILVRSLAERLKLTRKNDIRITAEYGAMLYALNPASFFLYNIFFPVQMSPDSPTWIRKMLRHAGFSENQYSPYELEVFTSKTILSLRLIDRNKKITIYAQDINKDILTGAEKAQFINKFSTFVFTVHFQ